MEIIDQFLKNENQKKPLSDREIADQLGINREKVTEYRKKHGIPNSRKRLYSRIKTDAFGLMKATPNLSHRELMRQLNENGYQISRQIALSLKNEFLAPKASTEANLENQSQKVESNVFSKLIGYDRSLKIQINQAQAAILYPPKGMHTLLYGESGVGKSQLAESMYAYSLKTENFDSDSPFVAFNCADYADNPQLLLSQLFGYVKGAFTGASQEKDGMIAAADGGILFLDEVHRLPSEGQEILFTILDKNTYRKLGETHSERKVNIMIIAATTENLESSLLKTFRRRIPMVIELPPLQKRTLRERYQLIRQFFKEESTKINKDIDVEKSTIKMLMTYDCPGNIGQLRSDIQVACARALLTSMINKKSQIHVQPSDVANHVKIGILDKNLHDTKLLKYTSQSFHFTLNEDTPSAAVETGNRYEISDWIYRFIEERSSTLESNGLTAQEINAVLSRELEQRFEDLSTTPNTPSITKTELKNLVGAKIASLLDTCQSVAQSYFPDLENSFYFTLGIHISAAYERLVQGKEIYNPHLKKVKTEYRDEFKVAKILGEIIQKELDIILPEDEIGFIAMYLKTFSTQSARTLSRVSVVILTHGKVGKSIAEVVNKLLSTDHAIGIEMSLTESPQIALEKTIKKIREIENGKGIALLVDMGSLVIFGDLITKELGIPVRVVNRVDTLMALEAVRRAILTESNLDEVVEGLADAKVPALSMKKSISRNNLPKAIVSICMTGEGAAKKIENFVNEVVKRLNHSISVFSIGMISMAGIDFEIQKIAKNFDILAFVGTINPEYETIPYISIESLYNNDGLTKLEGILKQVQNETVLSDILDDRLIQFDCMYHDKNEAIEDMVSQLEALGYVDRNFLLSVYRRESITPTFFKGNIAMPHGLPAHVNHPVIAIARLKRDILWDGKNKVDMIFLIAYKNNSKKYFKNFYRILLNQSVIKAIKSAENPASMKDLILENCEPNQ